MVIGTENKGVVIGQDKINDLKELLERMVFDIECAKDELIHCRNNIYGDRHEAILHSEAIESILIAESSRLKLIGNHYLKDV